MAYAAILTPWLALGALLVGRHVEVQAAPPVSVQGSHLGGLDVLVGTYAQLGVGVSLRGGAFPLGPSLRLQWLGGDPRAHWRVAIDGVVRLW